MLHRLRRTLRRRERLLHVRELQEELAQQALATLLREEDRLKEERDAFVASQQRTRQTIQSEMDSGAVPGETFVVYARVMEALHALEEQKAHEIAAMQPRITEHREEVLRRHKKKRAMEILTAKTRESVQHEELRLEQRTLDDLTIQRHHGRHGNHGTEA